MCGRYAHAQGGSTRKVCSCSGRQYSKIVLPKASGEMLKTTKGSAHPRPGSLAPAQLLNLKNKKNPLMKSHSQYYYRSHEMTHFKCTGIRGPLGSAICHQL